MIGDQDEIRSHLDDGTDVICDRYFTSTLAYQSVNGMEMETMLAFAEQFSFLRPDLAIYLHSSTSTAHERKTGEKDDLDRYEEDMDNQQQVAEVYEDMVAEDIFTHRWETVDAEPGIDSVRSSVLDAVAEVL
jgi:thymidylate kinase